MLNSKSISNEDFLKDFLSKKIISYHFFFIVVNLRDTENFLKKYLCYIRNYFLTIKNNIYLTYNNTIIKS